MKKLVVFILTTVIFICTLTACGKTTISQESFCFENTEWGMSKDQVSRKLKLSNIDFINNTSSESSDLDIYQVKDYKWKGVICDLVLAFSNGNDPFARTDSLCKVQIVFKDKQSFDKMTEELKKIIGEPPQKETKLEAITSQAWYTSKTVFSYFDENEKKYNKFIDGLLNVYSQNTDSDDSMEKHKASVADLYKNEYLASIEVLSVNDTTEETEYCGAIHFNGTTMNYVNGVLKN